LYELWFKKELLRNIMEKNKYEKKNKEKIKFLEIQT